MTPLPNPARRRRRVAIDAAMVLVMLVLMVQTWLLTRRWSRIWRGHQGVAVPALISSLVLVGVCLFLYRLVLRIDRLPETPAEGRTGLPPGPWQVGGDASEVPAPRSPQ